MNNRQSFVIIAVLLVAGLATPTSALAVEFTDDDLERLQAGKTIRKVMSTSRQNGFYGGTGWAIVDAPVDVIWEALRDWDAYPKVFPKTVSTEEVARKGDRSLVKMELGYKILKVGYYLNIVRDETEKKISFKMVSSKPHDIDNTAGYWRFFPQPDGRTLVAYAITLQVPRGIVMFLGDSVEGALERHLIGLPKYLKKWVESPAGNRYRTMTAKK